MKRSHLKNYLIFLKTLDLYLAEHTLRDDFPTKRAPLNFPKLQIYHFTKHIPQICGLFFLNTLHTLISHLNSQHNQ